MNPLVLGLALAAQGPAHPPVGMPPPVQYRQPAPQLLLAPPMPGYRPGYQPVPSYRPQFPPVYQPAPIVPVHQGPMTLEQFAHCFKPTPGTHHVCLIHPCTGRPVEVCFTLPPGCPKVEHSRHKLEFDYGRREVEIHFAGNGTVHVHND